MAIVALHLQKVMEKKSAKRMRYGSSHLADAGTVVQSKRNGAGQ
jgi:hypothetical protein